MAVYLGNVYFLSQDVYTFTMSDIDISTDQFSINTLEESFVGYLKDVKKTM